MPGFGEPVIRRLPDSDEIRAERARYIRVTMLKNSANTGVHIVELQAFGQE